MRARALMYCAALLAWGTAAAAQSAGTDVQEPARISVVGHATLQVPPDYAAVQVGVVAKAGTAAAALADNSAAVGRTIALAKALGVEATEIGTSAVSLQQAFKTVRNPSGGEQQPDGYQAQNLVTVRLRDIGRVGEFMRQAVEGGANRIDGVSFELKEPGRAERRAGAEATRDAVQRAQAVAEAAGIDLGPIERISVPARLERPFAPAPGLRMAVAEGRPAAVPIEAGTITVSADVEIVWAIKQRPGGTRP